VHGSSRRGGSPRRKRREIRSGGRRGTPIPFATVFIVPPRKSATSGSAASPQTARKAVSVEPAVPSPPLMASTETPSRLNRSAMAARSHSLRLSTRMPRPASVRASPVATPFASVVRRVQFTTTPICTSAIECVVYHAQRTLRASDAVAGGGRVLQQ
jgi:hypothetical protein